MHADIRWMRLALEQAERKLALGTPVQGFCPVWRKPWMAFASQTYIGDMLRLGGITNLFGERKGEDFFTVEIAEVVAMAPKIVVLPDKEEAGAEL